MRKQKYDFMGSFQTYILDEHDNAGENETPTMTITNFTPTFNTD